MRETRARQHDGPDGVDDLDKRIIEHLQEDGRRPFTRIADELGVSEAAVRARTNRLVERGILQIVGVTDPLRVGFHQMAMIGVRCEASKLMDVAARLAEMPEVDYVVVTAGAFDILVETVARTTRASWHSWQTASGRSTASARPRRSSISGCSSRRINGAPAEPLTGHVWCGPATPSCPGHHPTGRLPTTMTAAGSCTSPPEEHRPVPVDPVLALIAVAVIANLAIMAIVIVPPLIGRDGPFGMPEPSDAIAGAVRQAAVTGRPDTDLLGDGVPQRTYDRVVRIVAWIYLLCVFAIVVITGLWPETEASILVLLALAAVFIVIVHDLLPAGALGSAKFVIEGSVGITFASLLVLLTGQEASPFFFTFPLIVAGAALVVTPTITVALALAATVAYLAAVLLPVDAAGLTLEAIATVAINLAALYLLTYVAMVIAREQRRSREAAIRLSAVDALTGLFNRSFLFAAVEREIARSGRSGRGFCLLMMDLDDLKPVNDRYGHHTGDALLRSVGGEIRDGVRRIDTPARYGGDEFVVLCPETDSTGAFVLAEKSGSSRRPRDRSA